MTIPSDRPKRCVKCGETKTVSDFYVRTRINRGGKQYLASTCKECDKATARNWYHFGNTPEAILKKDQRENGIKRCTKCGEVKPVSEFYIQTADGKQHPSGECKVCFRDRTKTRVYSDKYTEIRNRDTEAIKKKRNRIKDAVFAAYGGYKCACCGETEKLFLTIDHMNNDGAKHRKSLSGRKHYGAGAHTYNWLIKNNFPDGFQVLCMNCNFGKRMNNGVCPHKGACNDQEKSVGLSSPKHTVPYLRIVEGRG